MKSNKRYCPLFVIGFNPPNESASYDPRVCVTDCAWYDNGNKQCILQSIYAAINDNMSFLDDICNTVNGFTDESLYDINEES